MHFVVIVYTPSQDVFCTDSLYIKSWFILEVVYTPSHDVFWRSIVYTPSHDVFWRAVVYTPSQDVFWKSIVYTPNHDVFWGSIVNTQVMMYFVSKRCHWVKGTQPTCDESWGVCWLLLWQLWWSCSPQTLLTCWPSGSSSSGWVDVQQVIPRTKLYGGLLASKAHNCNYVHRIVIMST